MEATFNCCSPFLMFSRSLRRKRLFAVDQRILSTSISLPGRSGNVWTCILLRSRYFGASSVSDNPRSQWESLTKLFPVKPSQKARGPPPLQIPLGRVSTRRREAKGSIHPSRGGVDVGWGCINCLSWGKTLKADLLPSGLAGCSQRLAGLHLVQESRIRHRRPEGELHVSRGRSPNKDAFPL